MTQWLAQLRAWGSINLLGEYDWSEERQKDFIGIQLPKLTDSTGLQIGSGKMPGYSYRSGGYRKPYESLCAIVGI